MKKNHFLKPQHNKRQSSSIKNPELHQQKGSRISRMQPKRYDHRRFKDQPRVQTKHKSKRQNSLMSEFVKQKRNNNNLQPKHKHMTNGHHDISPRYKKKKGPAIESSDYEFRERTCFQIFCLWCLRLFQNTKSSYKDDQKGKRGKNPKQPQYDTDQVRGSQQLHRSHYEGSSQQEQSVSKHKSSFVSQEISQSVQDLSRQIEQPAPKHNMNRPITPKKIQIIPKRIEPVQEQNQSQLESSIAKLKTVSSSQFSQQIQEVPSRRKPQPQKSKQKAQNLSKSKTKSQILKKKEHSEQKSVRLKTQNRQKEKKKLQKRLQEIKDEEKRTHKRNKNSNSSQSDKLRDLEGLVEKIFEKKLNPNNIPTMANYPYTNVFQQAPPHNAQYRGYHPYWQNPHRGPNQRTNYFSPPPYYQYPYNIPPQGPHNLRPHIDHQVNPEGPYKLPTQENEFSNPNDIYNYGRKSLNQKRGSSTRNDRMNFRDESDRLSQKQTLKREEVKKSELKPTKSVMYPKNEVKNTKETGNFRQKQNQQKSSAPQDSQFDQVFKNKGIRGSSDEKFMNNFSFGSSIINKNSSEMTPNVRKNQSKLADSTHTEKIKQKTLRNDAMPATMKPKHGNSNNKQQLSPQTQQIDQKAPKDSLDEPNSTKKNLVPLVTQIEATQAQEKPLRTTLRESTICIWMDSSNSFEQAHTGQQLQMDNIDFLVSIVEEDERPPSSTLGDLESLCSQIKE